MLAAAGRLLSNSRICRVPVVSDTVTAARTLSPADVAFTYHQRTKHALERYAPGPETLDWDAQPNPFREFSGAQRVELPLSGRSVEASYAALTTPGAIDPATPNLATLGALLQLAMGLSAWKEFGPDRWALRCNPSSGNLHPTEAYVLARDLPGLGDGLYHYLSREHALEQRIALAPGDGPARLAIGLSSVHWREAWKYGERAFRYCQLDTGHALGSVRYAAAALGWSAKAVEGISSDALAKLMGLDRDADFGAAEREDPDLLIEIATAPAPAIAADEAIATWSDATAGWAGTANVLDRHKLYRWPIIDEVAAATLGSGAGEGEKLAFVPPPPSAGEFRASDVILGRRSAQRFDAKTSMSAEAFYRMLDVLLPRAAAPWDVWTFTPRLHPVFLVHRVDGIEPGLYALPRRPGAAAALQAALRDDFEWKPVRGAPEHLPLRRLLPANIKAIAKTLCCHQAIASDGCFAVSMLAEFEETVAANPWRYRQLHWEAGLLGHVLYLEAEAADLRGTGIGCYFDDALHSLLGMTGRQFQALYHFTVGMPLTDTRITTSPPYPERQA